MFYIDAREPNVKVQRFRLAFGDNNVSVVHTEVADYYIDGFTLGIERKAPSDYIGSFCSHKLFSQATELARIFANPYIIVEGSLRDLIRAKRHLHISSLLGSIASLEAHYKVHVLFTASYNEYYDTDFFVEMVVKLVTKYTDNKIADYSPIREIRRPTRTFRDQQLYTLCSLPGIHTVRAEALLKHFGSVKAVFNATTEELTTVEGIGKETATRLAELIGGEK